VERNGRPEPEVPGSGPERLEAAAHGAAGQNPHDPAGEVPLPAEPGTARPVADAPASDGVAAESGPESAPPHGGDGAVGAPPPAWFWNDAASAGAPSDGASFAGAVATPAATVSGQAAQLPAAAGAVEPPPGWYPPGPNGAPYTAQVAPYPPGPYPPAGPYAPPPTEPPPTDSPPAATPPTDQPPRRRSSWAAPSPHRTHRWGLGAYLLAEAVFLLTSALVGFAMVDDAGPTAIALAAALAVPTMLAAATALLITWVRGNGPRIDLGLEWSSRDFGLGLAFGFGGLALTIPASIVYVAIVGEDATSAVGDVFGGIRAGPALAVLVLVIVVLVAPLCEEILYRGLLWGGIEKLAGRWVAFVVSTLMFALAHFELTRTPLLFVVAIPIAIARLYTGRLLASIVAHQINNLLPGVVLVLGLLGIVPMA
jgi:membrane protease YdiL (CAAX protease family)